MGNNYTTSADHIIVCRFNRPANKHITLAADRLVKTALHASQNADTPPAERIYCKVARHVYVPDAESLADVLRKVAADPHLVVIAGHVPELLTRIGTGKFLIRSTQTISTKLGRPVGGIGRNVFHDLPIKPGSDKTHDLPVIARNAATIAPSNWLLLDRDINEHIPTEYADLDDARYLAALSATLPGVDAAPVVVMPSSTGRVVFDGAPLAASGTHYWIRTEQDAHAARNALRGERSRFRRAAMQRAVLDGIAVQKRVGGSSAHRTHCLFDPSVFDGERWVYGGAPVIDEQCAARVTLTDPIIHVTRAAGSPFRTESCESLTAQELYEYQQRTGLTIGRDGWQEYVGGITLETEFCSADGVITIADYLEDYAPAKLRSTATPSGDHFRISNSGTSFYLRTTTGGMPVLFDASAQVRYLLPVSDQRVVTQWLREQIQEQRAAEADAAFDAEVA